MRSKGFRFTLGVWGLRVCSLDVAFTVATVRNRSQPSATVRNRSQPFATVRNRPREDHMAVPMGSFAEVVLFGGFRRVVASFRVAGVALRDIQTCSGTCRKSFCVAGAILLRRFQKMCCSFRGRRSTLDASIVIFRGRRTTLDVSCCVFFVNRIGRAASSGEEVQIPWQAWHFVRCAKNWRKPRTKHRFWGCKFSGSKEAAKCENWRKSRTKCSFWCSHLSLLACLVFPWPRRVYGGSCKTCLFVVLPTVKIAGSLAQNAGFSASMCPVSSRLFFCGVAVSMGEAGKPVLFECFQAGCHVVLRGRRGTFDIPTCLMMLTKLQNWRKSRTKCCFFLHPSVLSRVSRFPVASPCLWGKSQNFSFSNVSTQVVDNVSKMSKLDEVSHEMFGFLHPRVSFRVSGFSVASLCLWGKLEHVSFAKVSNFECTGLLVQWGLRFVKIWQECDYVESGKLLCGLIQISHSVVYIFLVLCRQTFRLCSIARERQAFTVHDRGVYRDIARRWFSNVRDRYPSKCRMHGSVADSGMKFDSDVVEDLCL